MPIQDEPNGPMAWRDITVQGAEALAARAGKKLRHEKLLMAELGGTRLRLELDMGRELLLQTSLARSG